MNDGGTPTATESVSNAALFALFRRRRRRTAVAVLASVDGAVTLNELTRAVVRRERDGSIADVSGDRLTQVSVTLHHNHLPRLDDAGVVEYDPDRRRVRPAADLDRAASALAAVREALESPPEQTE